MTMTMEQATTDNVQVEKLAMHNAQVASLLSLNVFASRNKVTPMLMQVAIQRRGDKLWVWATDRYAVVRGVYPLDVDTSEPYDMEESMIRFIDEKDARAFLPMVKKLDGKGYAYVTQNGIELSNGSMVTWSNVTGSYPPVDKLFAKEKTDTAPRQLSIKPGYVARLEKIVSPSVSRKWQNDPWIFTFAETDTGKPAPIHCVPLSRDGGEIDVLIQPNHLTTTD
jgi:hypothetical protein